MSNALRRAVVKTVKPLVGETNWQRLRSRAGRPPARELTPRQQRRQRLQQMDLTELGREEFGTDKWGRHRYTPHYERHLGHLRDEKFTLFEIGIGGYDPSRAGRGLAADVEALLPPGADRRPRHRGQVVRRGARIRAYTGSQTDGRCCARSSTSTGGPGGRRRRQPPPRARPRDVPASCSRCCRRRLLRHRGHPDHLLAEWGGSDDRTTRDHDGAGQGPGRRPELRGVPRRGLPADVHRPQVVGRALPTTTS